MTNVAEKQNKINEAMAEWQKQFPGIGQSTGRILNNAVESIFKLTNIKRVKHN